MFDQNPYNWRNPKPQIRIRREPLHSGLTKSLSNGDSFALLGSRGMGKSTFLWDLYEGLSADAQITVVRISEPPAERTKKAAVDFLANRLGVETYPAGDVERLLQSWIVSKPEGARLVLLFDNLDTWTDRDAPVTWARDFFSSLETASQTFAGQVGILGAGGLELIWLTGTQIGSPFLSRATQKFLSPFGCSELEALVEPFQQKGSPLEDEVKDLLLLLSGGNPALLTYGLQSLWEMTVHPLRPMHVEEVYAQFQDPEHIEFVRSVRRGVGDRSDSPTRRVWHFIRRQEPPILRADLRKLVPEDSPDGVDLDRALELLLAAGLIRVEGRLKASPLQAWAVASILNLPEPEERSEAAPLDIRTHLRADLERLIGHIHRWQLDFFRSQEGTELLPETTFSAFLALGLREAGWEAFREAQQGEGYLDIRLSHPAHAGHAVVEVKRWENADRKHIHDQVLKYRDPDTQTFATVLIRHTHEERWLEEYREACLSGLKISEERTLQGVTGSLLLAQRTDGPYDSVNVDHYLLILTGRRKR